MFFIITGKGGVGKSTCSVLLANYLCSRGKTVLYFYSPSPIHRFANQRVILYHLDVEREAKEYLKLKLPFFLRYHLSRSTVFRIFLRLIPGLSELIVLGRMWYDFYTGKYEFYVFDGLPTGQIISVLEIPRAGVMSSVGGLARSDFERMEAFVRSARLILVSVPEQVVHEESEEFIASARARDLNFDTVFLNKFYTRNLSRDELRWMESMIAEGRLNEREKREFVSMIQLDSFLSKNSEKFYESFANMGIRVIKIPFSIEGLNWNFFVRNTDVFGDHI